MKTIVVSVVWRLARIGEMLGGGRPGNAVHRHALRLGAWIVRLFGGALESRVAVFGLPLEAHRYAFLERMDLATAYLRAQGFDASMRHRVLSRSEAEASTDWRHFCSADRTDAPEGVFVVEVFVAASEWWAATHALETHLGASGAVPADA